MVQLPVGLDRGRPQKRRSRATEAKAQPLATRGVPGTGTATDAVALVWPAEASKERFAGPRSEWGARIVQASTRQYRLEPNGADRVCKAIRPALAIKSVAKFRKAGDVEATGACGESVGRPEGVRSDQVGARSSPSSQTTSLTLRRPIRL